MAPELVALLDKPHLLILVLGLGAFSGMMVERLVTELRRRRWREQRGQGRRSNSAKRPGTTPTATAKPAQDAALPSPSDAAEQLRIVMSAAFSVQPLLNKPEARVFKELDQAVIARNAGWQVMAQVSLGEILRSPDARAYGCINSKRVDLLLMDESCRPRHAIEYQGTGHHQGTAAARDAVKKEALRRAGIGYHEVVAGQTTPSDLRRLVERLVDAPATPA